MTTNKEININLNMNVKGGKKSKGGFAGAINDDVSGNSKNDISKSIEENETDVIKGHKVMKILRQIMGESIVTAIYAIPNVMQYLLRSMYIIIPAVLGLIFGSRFVDWVTKKITGLMGKDDRGSDLINEESYRNIIEGGITSPLPIGEPIEGIGEENDEDLMTQFDIRIDLNENVELEIPNTVTETLVNEVVKVHQDNLKLEDDKTFFEKATNMTLNYFPNLRTWLDGGENIDEEEDDKGISSTFDEIDGMLQGISNVTDENSKDFMGPRQLSPSDTLMSSPMDLNYNLKLDTSNFEAALAKVSSDDSITKPIERFNEALNQSISNETTQINTLVTGPYNKLNNVLTEVVNKIDKIKGLKSDLASAERAASSAESIASTTGTIFSSIINSQPQASSINLISSPLQTPKNGGIVSGPDQNMSPDTGYVSR